MRTGTFLEFASALGSGCLDCRANSLFHNILRASPCGSILCAPSEISRSRKSNEINILEEVLEKKMETGMETCNREGHDFESCRMLAATDNGLQPLRASAGSPKTQEQTSGAKARIHFSET